MDILSEYEDGLRDTGVRLFLVADVCWPCEARFLRDCWADDPSSNEKLMPYPLLDLSSFLMAKGYDPTGIYARLESELPAHNPLKDARQSSRIFHLLRSGESVPMQIPLWEES